MKEGCLCKEDLFLFSGFYKSHFSKTLYSTWSKIKLSKVVEHVGN